MKRSEILFSALLVPADGLALLAAFILSYSIRESAFLISPEDVGFLAERLQFTGSPLILTLSQYLRYIWFVIPVMLLFFALAGLYAMRPTSNWLQRFLHILIGVSTGEFFILLLFLLKKDFFLPRSTIIYSWILGTVFVLVGRVLMRLLQKGLYSYNIGIIKVGVIGINEVAEQIIRQLSANKSSAYRLSFQYDSLEVAKVLKQIQQEKIDELIVVSERYRNEDLVILRNHCLEHHLSFSFVPPLLTELQSSFEVRSVGKLPVIEVRPTPLEGWGRVIKGLFDLAVAVCLIILFSPLYLLIGLAMLITDPGPLIYRHRRIGKNKVPIDILKFRTMRWEYCDGPGGHPKGSANKNRLFRENPNLAKEWKETMKLKNDPRVSAIGQILRKTSFDELPQFFNVLKGDLSLVGPRPIIQDEVSRFGETARILFSVKPGITGLWQIKGRNEIPYEERVALNMFYIEHWNLGMDIIILFKTTVMLIKELASSFTKKGQSRAY